MSKRYDIEVVAGATDENISIEDVVLDNEEQLEELGVTIGVSNPVSTTDGPDDIEEDDEQEVTV